MAGNTIQDVRFANMSVGPPLGAHSGSVGDGDVEAMAEEPVGGATGGPTFDDPAPSSGLVVDPAEGAGDVTEIAMQLVPINDPDDKLLGHVNWPRPD
jgi:hypothetical protein